MLRLLFRIYQIFSVPFSILMILDSRKIHPAYRMGTCRKMRLGTKMFRNCRRIPTGSSYKVHLAMALKLLETPPEVPGDVIECGTYKGGSAANLSLVCRIVGRKLRIYDSFEGLPPGEAGDRAAAGYREGDFRGTLAEVTDNIRRYGAPECCRMAKGWFKDTLPALDTPVLLAFLDVDLEASLHDCVRHIWRNLVDRGYIFMDEAIDPSYAALFYSEKWWETYFQCPPPGLIGAGTGLPLGQYYVGPLSQQENHPLHAPGSGAYTQKGMSGHWTYYPRNDR
ncbi:MAG: TylF/MycF/NovP-related O-methyltransferase [Chloroflexota bacterium]